MVLAFGCSRFRLGGRLRLATSSFAHAVLTVNLQAVAALTGRIKGDCLVALSSSARRLERSFLIALAAIADGHVATRLVALTAIALLAFLWSSKESLVLVLILVFVLAPPPHA